MRRSCQTMALWIGRPVARSQTIVVSRWLVMPRAAISLARAPARAIAARAVASVVDQDSPRRGRALVDREKIIGQARSFAPPRPPAVTLRRRRSIEPSYRRPK